MKFCDFNRCPISPSLTPQVAIKSTLEHGNLRISESEMVSPRPKPLSRSESNNIPREKVSTVANAKGPGFLTITQRTMGEHGRITMFTAVARCRDSVTSCALFGDGQNKTWNLNFTTEVPRKLTMVC